LNANTPWYKSISSPSFTLIPSFLASFKNGVSFPYIQSKAKRALKKIF